MAACSASGLISPSRATSENRPHLFAPTLWPLAGGVDANRSQPSPPRGLEGQAVSHLATVHSPWTRVRISSTISGLASVVTSPMSRPSDIAASTRRMIFPERVLGISGTT